MAINYIPDPPFKDTLVRVDTLDVNVSGINIGDMGLFVYGSDVYLENPKRCSVIPLKRALSIMRRVRSVDFSCDYKHGDPLVTYPLSIKGITAGVDLPNKSFIFDDNDGYIEYRTRDRFISSNVVAASADVDYDGFYDEVHISLNVCIPSKKEWDNPSPPTNGIWVPLITTVDADAIKAEYPTLDPSTRGALTLESDVILEVNVDCFVSSQLAVWNIVTGGEFYNVAQCSVDLDGDIFYIPMLGDNMYSPGGGVFNPKVYVVTYSDLTDSTGSRVWDEDTGALTGSLTD